MSGYPRIRDLPEKEQEPFREWLRGSTIPHLDGVPMDEQDAYYSWDYVRWKGGLLNDD
jgi:hypothetical protein